MSVDKPDIVDILSIDSSGRVVLTISDHLDWRESIQHQRLLQQKINRYPAFVESGEIEQQCPRAQGRRVLIRLVRQHQPDENGLGFLGRVADALRRADFAFEWGAFRSEDEAEDLRQP